MTSDDAMIATRVASWLPAARWFADKGERIATVGLHERVPIPRSDDAALVLGEVHLAGCDPSPRYVMVTDTVGDDIAATPACARWLLDLVLSGGSLPGRFGRFVGHAAGHVAASATVGPVGPVTVHAIGGDASNTSLVVRSAAAGWIIKLFRRCREGIQPEVEVGEFFAEHSPWQDTPRLCGWLEYVPAGDGPAGDPTAIATVHAFAPGHVTGWERLVDVLTSGGGLGGRSGDEIFAIVAALGRVTCRMHRAFSARLDIPAFAPTPATRDSLQAAATRMREHAERVFASIDSRIPQVAPEIARRLAAVSAARATLVGRFASLPSLALAATAIRVHGDYHLGQVLVAGPDDKPGVHERDGVLVIDFEGEPGRTLAERREKTAAAKDVAGMCRSFDYLLRHVATSTGRPYAAADLSRLEACFLDAYCEGAAKEPWWPADRQAADGLLEVFKLDKAIYELAYELHNRPDWIDVPLAAIEEAMATADRSPGWQACRLR